MQKVFPSELNDFYYAFVGSMFVRRMHAELQRHLRLVVSAMLDNEKDRIIAAKAGLMQYGGGSSNSFIVATKVGIFEIEVDPDRMVNGKTGVTVTEYDLEDLVVGGLHSDSFLMAYEIYKHDLKKALVKSTNWSNMKDLGHDFFKLSKLKEFTKCE